MAGKIKSISRFHRPLNTPEADFENEEFSGMITHYTELDENGNVNLEITYDTEGLVETRVERKYDNSGRLLREMLYDEEGEITEDHNFTYNNGRLDSETITYLDGSVDTVQFDYDNSGNELKMKRINDDGEEEERRERSYSGNLICKEELFEEGKMVNEVINEYDENGLLVFTSSRNRQDPVVELRYDYDDNGYNIKVSRYVNGKLTEITEYDRDEAGTVKGMRERDAYRNVYVTMKYDEAGRIVEQVETNEEGEEVGIIHRQYDDLGNMLYSEVYIAGDGRHPGNHYQVIYEYEFH